MCGLCDSRVGIGRRVIYLIDLIDLINCYLWRFRKLFWVVCVNVIVNYLVLILLGLCLLWLCEFVDWGGWFDDDW